MYCNIRSNEFQRNIFQGTFAALSAAAADLPRSYNKAKAVDSFWTGKDIWLLIRTYEYIVREKAKDFSERV